MPESQKETLAQMFLRTPFLQNTAGRLRRSNTALSQEETSQRLNTTYRDLSKDTR